MSELVFDEFLLIYTVVQIKSVTTEEPIKFDIGK